MPEATKSDLASLRGGVRIELGGSMRTLRFDFNSLAAIEEKTGRNMLAPDAWDSVDARSMRLFVWAALIHEAPELTPEQVGSWITEAGMVEVQAAFIAARMASLPPLPKKSGSREVSRKKNPPVRVRPKKKGRTRRRG